MLKQIETETDHDEALKQVYELMQTNIKEGSAGSDELEILNRLVEKYELTHYPIIFPSTNAANNIESHKSNS